MKFNFLQGSLYVFLGLASYKLLYILTQIIIARILGAYNFGLISLGTTFLALLCIVSRLGTETGIRRFIPTSNNSEARDLLRYSSSIVIFASIVIASIMYLSSTKLSLLFGNSDLAPIFQIFALIIPFNALKVLFLRGLEGFQEMKYRFYIEGLLFGFLLLGSILIAVNFGVTAACFAFLITYIVTALTSFYTLNKKIRFIKQTNKTKLRKKFFNYSWPVTFYSTLEVGIRHFNIIIIGILLSESDVGIYAASMSLAIFIPALLYVATPVFFPLASKLNTNDSAKLYKKITKTIVLVTIPIFAIAIIFSKSILLIFGSEFQEVTLFRLLLIAFFIEILAGPIESYLNSFDYTKLTMINMIVAVVTNIVFAFILIPKYGLVGAGFAFILGILIMKIMAVIELYYLKRILPY